MPELNYCGWCDRYVLEPCENEAQSVSCDHGWKGRLVVQKSTGEILDCLPEPNNPIEPDHYKRFRIEPLEFCAANEFDVFQTNIIKYACRYKYKNGVEDLDKLINYAYKARAHLLGNPEWIKVGTPKQ